MAKVSMSSNTNKGATMEHSKDTDCTLDATDCCTGCGIYHGDPCPTCGGCGFHAPECEDVDGCADAYAPPTVLEIARNILANAKRVQLNKQDVATDCYAVPLDDILALESAVAREES